MRRLLHPSFAVALSASLLAAPVVQAAEAAAPEVVEPVVEPALSPGELFSSGQYLEAADAFGAITSSVDMLLAWCHRCG